MQDIKSDIHFRIVKNLIRIEKWFSDKSKGLFFPFYSSFDIRDSGKKIAPVDANIFPAGFNNICPIDQEASVDLIRAYFKCHYPDCRNLILLSEEHTQNLYYWNNVGTLRRLLTEAGLNVRVAMPKNFDQRLLITNAAGEQIEVYPAIRRGTQVEADGMTADLVISNNDFSQAYQDWVSGLQTPINPPHQLGWHTRRKDQFFKEYNFLATEFSELLGIDPWVLTVETETFLEFDINSDSSREALAIRVDQMVQKMSDKYRVRDVTAQPFVFIKNNSGTYGLGVTQVSSGDEVRTWNYNARKKMKAVKGGGSIQQVIVQEGIPTILTSDEGATAEPTIYMIGCQLAGGFLRTHQAKGPKDNLNSPGAVFKRLCLSDLNINVEGHPLENVYGWIANLSFLAIAREARNHNVVCSRFCNESDA